jgi:hypothetical protein
MSLRLAARSPLDITLADATELECASPSATMPLPHTLPPILAGNEMTHVVLQYHWSASSLTESIADIDQNTRYMAPTSTETEPLQTIMTAAIH